MMTLTGSGYSQYEDIVLNRWREDPTLDMYGTFIYVQNLNSGGVWSPLPSLLIIRGRLCYLLSQRH